MMQGPCTRSKLCLGISVSALIAAAPAQAQVAGDPARASLQAPPIAPAARAQRLNPTARNIVLTVPVKDGATYLGDIALTIGVDDALSFPADRMLQLLGPVLDPKAFEALRGSLAGKTTARPDDFSAGGLQLDYDPRTLELRLLIPAEIRVSRNLSVAALDRQSLGAYVQPEAFSAYLNIRSTLDLVEDGFDTGFSEPVFLLGGATRFGEVVAEGDAIWSPGGRGADFQRLGSRLIHDDTLNLVRYTLGDLLPQARGFQAAPEIAGISISRSYSVLNPQQVVRPRGDRTFRLDRQSTVEVIVNGQQVRRLTLAPGNYNLRDFPFAQGANDIRLNVLDDTGRTEVLRFNVFMDQTQLAKGLTEFGLFAGVKAPMGLRGPNYSDDFAITGYVRHGLSDFVTVGANFQADDYVKMGGAEAVFGTAIGTFGTGVAYSSTKGVGDGYALQASFQRLFQRRNGQSDSLNLFIEHRSKKFAPVTFMLPNNPYAFEAGGGYSHAFSSEFYAGFDARFSKGRGQVPDVENYRLSGGWRLSPTASFTAETRYERDARGRQWSGFLTLTVRLGKFSSVRSEFDTRDSRIRSTYQTIQGSGVGSYNISADVERSNIGAATSVNASYFANRAELGFSHFGNYTPGFGNSISQRSTMRVGTSIALAGGAVSIGRPIYDSFAIVKPHRGLGKANVLLEPSPFGYSGNTGTLGAATMPSLSSYAERTLPVDVSNAAPGTDIGQGSFKLYPGYRSGYKLEVGSDYNVVALGTMQDAQGNPLSLVAGTATQLDNPGREPMTFFTNRIGRFGLTGLAPGKWRLEMLDQNKSVYILDVPDDAVRIVQVGEITPVKEK